MYHHHYVTSCPSLSCVIFSILNKYLRHHHQVLWSHVTSCFIIIMCYHHASSVCTMNMHHQHQHHHVSSSAFSSSAFSSSIIHHHRHHHVNHPLPLPYRNYRLSIPHFESPVQWSFHQAIKREKMVTQWNKNIKETTCRSKNKVQRSLEN